MSDPTQLDTLTAFLVDRYGLLLGRESLKEALGFPSLYALDQYVRRGHLDLKLLQMPNRRGKFALATEVAAYLLRISDRRAGASVGGKERDAR